MKFNGIIMVSGPSGVGKSTLVNTMIEGWPNFYFRPKSYTTRAKRNALDEEYCFVDREEINSLFNRGLLINLDDVYGNLYSMEKMSVDNAIACGLRPIKEIHPKNQKPIKSAYGDSISILLLPENSEGETFIRNEDVLRHDDDVLFYRQIDTSQFDLILKWSKKDLPAAQAGSAHLAIAAYLKTLRKYPHPGTIDLINAQGYQKIAAHFTENERVTTSNFHSLTAGFFESVIGGIANGSRCLEIGPGQGWLRKAFRWPNCDYCTVDISEKMLATLGFENVGIEKLNAPIRATPFHASTFDYILGSLGDGYCYPSALTEIRRILKPGGRFVFTAPSKEWAAGLRRHDKIDRTRFVLPDGDFAEVYSFVADIDELTHLFEICGFNVLKAEQMYGRLLDRHAAISEALTRSASNLGIDFAFLPIVNAIIAEKSE